MQAAVNISVVAGKLSAERAQAMSSRGREINTQGGQDYSAAALSLVYHPGHPFVPTLRADIRRFKVNRISGIYLLMHTTASLQMLDIDFCSKLPPQ